MTEDEKLAMIALETLARVIYRIGKKQGADAAKAQIRGVVAALHMMDNTIEETLANPLVIQ